jgi:hypothetical protein
MVEPSRGNDAAVRLDVCPRPGHGGEACRGQRADARGVAWVGAGVNGGDAEMVMRELRRPREEGCAQPAPTVLGHQPAADRMSFPVHRDEAREPIRRWVNRDKVNVDCQPGLSHESSARSDTKERLSLASRHERLLRPFEPALGLWITRPSLRSILVTYRGTLQPETWHVQDMTVTVALVTHGMSHRGRNS